MWLTTSTVHIYTNRHVCIWTSVCNKVPDWKTICLGHNCAQYITVCKQWQENTKVGYDTSGSYKLEHSITCWHNTVPQGEYCSDHTVHNQKAASFELGPTPTCGSCSLLTSSRVCMAAVCFCVPLKTSAEMHGIVFLILNEFGRGEMYNDDAWLTFHSF